VALAIGANIAMFRVVNAVLLRPLPFSYPGRVVQVAEKNDKLHLASFGSSVLNFVSWREQSNSFQELGAVGYANFTLTGKGDPEQVSGNLLSPALMGVRSLHGRFVTETDAAATPKVAVIDENLARALWPGKIRLVS
jgi:hypothetical protein